MFRSVRSRLTYANVLSTIALFLAMSGGAYALTIPRNSVGTKQLKRSAVTGAKVRNGSLGVRDFKRGSVPAGARGAAGPPGAPGAPGTPGATGPRGPSELRTHQDSFGNPVSGAGYANLHNYSVPAGQWWVSWSAVVDTASTGGVLTTCRLQGTATTYDERPVLLSSTTDSRVTLLEAKVAGPAFVSPQCKAGNAAHSYQLRDRRFVAMTADRVNDAVFVP